VPGVHDMRADPWGFAPRDPAAWRRLWRFLLADPDPAPATSDEPVGAPAPVPRDPRPRGAGAAGDGRPR
jgi:hypothetical protein